MSSIQVPWHDNCSETSVRVAVIDWCACGTDRAQRRVIERGAHTADDRPTPKRKRFRYTGAGNRRESRDAPEDNNDRSKRFEKKGGPLVFARPKRGQPPCANNTTDARWFVCRHWTFVAKNVSERSHPAVSGGFRNRPRGRLKLIRYLIKWCSIEEFIIYLNNNKKYPLWSIYPMSTEGSSGPLGSATTLGYTDRTEPAAFCPFSPVRFRRTNRPVKRSRLKMSSVREQRRSGRLEIARWTGNSNPKQDYYRDPCKTVREKRFTTTLES